ncbi:MAG: SusC/RagA family TonB-linked outer membrane protein [Bacteroidaceae bacterium]|nr:SusC/RagA family TonB-linked outer membrane protein [Bacteroidaceae bacterium]
MYKKLVLLLACLLVGIGTIYAQKRVSGTVVDEEGHPVIGANVKVPGTSKGAQTDLKGAYVINNVPESVKKLNITYIGMEATSAAAREGVRTVMKMSNNTLGEAVAMGMLKMDKRLVTGSTTKVDMEKVKLDGVPDVARALEGQVAGVSVQNVSGTFGTAPKIRVRGATSIYGSSNPLWVVDGVILENIVNVSADDLSSGDAETLISSAVAGLNADDIESFQVLKDGSATSIYGARAMAGVIVITTKKGRAGHSQINYTGELTYRMKPSYSDYNVCNSQEQMGIYKEMAQKGWMEFSSLANSSSSGIYGQMYTLIDKYNTTSGQFGLPYTEAAMNAYLRQAEMRNTDWFDLLYRNTIMQNHSVSVTTGTEKANVYASLSVMNDPGWSLGNNVQRYTANVNASYNLLKNLTVTLRTSDTFRKQKVNGSLDQTTDVVSGQVSREFDINPFSYCLNTSRTMDPNAIYKRNYADFNIFKELENNYAELAEADMKFQAELSYKPIAGLDIQGLVSYRTDRTNFEHFVLNNSNYANAYRAGVDNPNIMYSNKYLYTDPDQPNSLPVSVMPEGGIYLSEKNVLNHLYTRGSVTYSRDWNGIHILNVYGGVEANKADRDRTKAKLFGVDYDMGRVVVITPAFYKQAKEEGAVLNSFNRSWDNRMAFFANANYSYKGRYTLNLTGRFDGSNQLGKGAKNRWLPTYNISASWNMHEETWFRGWANEHNHWLSHSTLRASYSLVGEQNNASNYYSIFNPTIVWRPWSDQQQTGVYLAQNGNTDLDYEKKHEYNFGIDLGFLDNRINLVTDFYWRQNFDLMGYTNTQGLGGEIRKYGNVAKMKSHGVEATISSTNIRTKDWSWNTDLTFSYCVTEITDLLSRSRVIDLVTSSGYPLQGYPHRAIFSIPFMGLNDEGIPQVLNENGEVTTTNINFQEYEKLDFLKYEGPVEPVYTGGLGNIVRWKNWRLNLFLTYSFGNKVRLQPVFSAAYSDQSAMPKDFKNRWVMPGDEAKTTVPTIASTRQYSTINSLNYAYNAYNYSTERVANGGFIRLKDISLTYELPQRILDKANLKNLSFKLDATNLLLLYSDKKLNGQDPEFINAGGVAQPLSKQFTFTIRLGL